MHSHIPIYIIADPTRKQNRVEDRTRRLCGAGSTGEGTMEKCFERSGSRRRITIQKIVDIVIWLVVAIPVLFIFLSGVPFHRGFFCDDDTITYPHKPETISTTMLIASSFGISIATVVIVEVLTAVDCRRRRRFTMDNLNYILNGYAAFLVGVVIVELFTEGLKNQVGRLRPNFIAVCQPKYNQSLCTNGGYIRDYQCTSLEHGAAEQRDSRQSFPSGHSSLAMYIATYFSVYIYHRLAVSYSNILPLVLQALLVLAAVVCGVTRLQDNMHHPTDVIGGSILGILVTMAIYVTLGRKVLQRQKVTFPRRRGAQSPQSESSPGAMSLEPQTPLPLLSNEYTNGTSTPFTLKENPFIARRHTADPLP